ncbi:MAG TPA: pyridoxamine 5'-phosphate oxidase family protein [Acidimicrobiales bacterium]|jgi:general stress protein 26|nr:pyridoxamine 5'-phosphate oxidase family protein [Acidimicrobiales bacterium]
MANRSPEERKADALAKLEAADTNLWIASASPTGVVHLVPVTKTWNGSQVVLATGPKSRTVANVTANPRVRLALGDTRDVVMIDAVLVEAVPESEAPKALADAYAMQAGWDPRTDDNDYVYLRFGLDRVEVWREAEDSAGRTVMRNGAWTV